MLLVLRGLAESLKEIGGAPRFPHSPALFLLLGITGQTTIQELFFFPYISRC